MLIVKYWVACYAGDDEVDSMRGRTKVDVETQLMARAAKHSKEVLPFHPPVEVRVSAEDWHAILFDALNYDSNVVDQEWHAVQDAGYSGNFWSFLGPVERNDHDADFDYSLRVKA